MDGEARSGERQCDRIGSLSDLWLIPLGVGGAGAVALMVCVHRLNKSVSELHSAMRPLRVRTRGDVRGGRAL